jgi:hypothetical protein
MIGHAGQFAHSAVVRVHRTNAGLPQSLDNLLSARGDTNSGEAPRRPDNPAAATPHLNSGHRLTRIAASIPRDVTSTHDLDARYFSGQLIAPRPPHLPEKVSEDGSV